MRDFSGFMAVVLLAFGFPLLALGCEVENDSIDGPLPGVGSRGVATAGNGGGSTVSIGNTQGWLCPLANATQLCSCAGPNGAQLVGRQTCNTVSGWSQCECAADPGTHIPGSNAGSSVDAINKGDARFEWYRTVPTGGSCEAGNYAGALTGLYASQAMSTGGIGFYTAIPVEGDLGFNIEEKPGSNGEWFEISDGHFRGSALFLFPFVGDFYGALECSTRSFTGALKNCYYIVEGDKYAFQGITVSSYDTINHTFVSGIWSVTEPEGSAVFDSPSNPNAPYPADELFPIPLPLQAGTRFQGFLPALFQGGVGDWNAAYLGR